MIHAARAVTTQQHGLNTRGCRQPAKEIGLASEAEAVHAVNHNRCGSGIARVLSQEEGDGVRQRSSLNFLVQVGSGGRAVRQPQRVLRQGPVDGTPRRRRRVHEKHTGAGLGGDECVAKLAPDGVNCHHCDVPLRVEVQDDATQVIGLQ
jgi:hypothetical protein